MDQYMAMCNECDELGQKFGRLEDDVKAVFIQEGATNPTKEQLERAFNQVEEESSSSSFNTRQTRRNMTYLLKKWKTMT